MADLHQIIYPHPSPDHRIATRAAINAATGANLRPVANNHPAKLWHSHMLALSGGDEAKTLIADPRALVQHNAFTRDAVFHAGISVDAPMCANLTAGAYRAVMRQNAMRTNFSARPNENKGADFTAGADNGVWRNHRRWMDAGLWLRWRVE